VLYLAEVQKQKGGLLSGGAKTELKLLACQRTDQNWNTVSEEVIAAEDASKLNDGALVLVELNPNRQVQRIQEAGRPLVNILQNFSRQLEKFKLKEDEIDQWKQSLTFQAQELNRREMDMEVRSEQLQQLEDELQQLEEQKQEVDTSRQEIERLQTEVEGNRLELEGAWEHLRGEQRRLEEHLADFQQGTVLDEEQSRVMSELLDRLSSRVAPTEIVREQLHLAFELVEKQQATLTPHWQKLQEQKTAIAQHQEEVELLSQTFSDRQNALQQAQNSLVQQTAQLQILLQIETQRQQYSQEIQKLEREIDQIRAGIGLNQGMIDNQTHDLDEKRQELKAIEENLLSLRRTTAECCGRVNLYQEALQPIQDSLDGLRQKLQGIGESLDQFQETGDSQAQAIAQLRHTLQSLMSQPQLLAS
jgi:chromosome segregation ATPase